MSLRMARAVDRGVILSATTALACKQYGFPSDQAWASLNRNYTYALIGLIIVAGLFGVVTPFESYTRHLRVERRVAIRRHVLIAFGQLFDICKKISQPLYISDLGLHFWQKKHTFRHPVQGELIRISTYRLGSAPATRKLQPTRGFGVVGLCWKHDREVSVNVEGLTQDLTDEARFIAFRDREGTDAVMGFSWEEFRRYSHRGAVFASPIRNAGSKFVGCVSFDVSHGYDSIDVQRVWHVLNALSFILGQDGFEDA
jgi:hypothetical protein